MVKVSWILGGVAFIAALCAAASGPESSRAEHTGPAAPAFTTHEPEPLAVRIASAEKARLRLTRATVGWIEPSASIKVRSRVSGEIVEQKVVEGQVVEIGDVLFRLDERETRARIRRSEALLARDRARLERAAADLARLEELVRRAAASPAQRDQAAADVEILAAEVVASEAMLMTDQIALDHATVRSPVAGRVGAITVSRGSFVGTPETEGVGLLTITQARPARVSFRLPESDLRLLRTSLKAVNDPAHISVFAPGDGRLLGSGSIAFLDPVVDSKTGTIRVVGVVPNDDDVLWPGQYVRVSVDFGAEEESVTVPLGALISSAEGANVFVVGPDNRAMLREIVLAGTRGGLAFVTGGIEPGESVVVGSYPQLIAGVVVATAAEPQVAVADRQPGDTSMVHP